MSDEAPRLFLITPRITDAAAFAPLLEAALDAGDVACVLARTDARDEGTIKSVIRVLAPIAQARGAACLVDDNARLAPRADADGVQIRGPGPGLAEALAALKPDRIVGVGGLLGRDEAMEAGEAGADYLMFGGPDEATPHDVVRERASWWAEIFNVPCVAYAREPALAGDLVETGAEFIAICEGLWDHPDTIASIIASVSRALAGETVR
jgi:thiamine-phosphate pyrophosphorylase